MLEPEPEPEPVGGAVVQRKQEQGSEFKQITVNTAEQNRYKSGNLQTRKINAEKVAAGSKGARATKALDVRAAKKEYFFIYEKRHLDWWKSQKEHQKKGSVSVQPTSRLRVMYGHILSRLPVNTLQNARKGRINVSEIVDVWLDEGKSNNRFQIKVKADEEEPEATFQ